MNLQVPSLEPALPVQPVDVLASGRHSNLFHLQQAEQRIDW